MSNSSWSNLAIRLDAREQSAMRTDLRSRFGVSSAVPVIESADCNAPKLTGTRGGHFTCGGMRIRFPGAYSRSGWSNMVYICTSQVITVPIGYSGE